MYRRAQRIVKKLPSTTAKRFHTVTVVFFLIVFCTCLTSFLLTNNVERKHAGDAEPSMSGDRRVLSSHSSGSSEGTGKVYSQGGMDPNNLPPPDATEEGALPDEIKEGMWDELEKEAQEQARQHWKNVADAEEREREKSAADKIRQQEREKAAALLRTKEMEKNMHRAPEEVQKEREEVQKEREKVGKYGGIYFDNEKTSSPPAQEQKALPVEQNALPVEQKLTPEQQEQQVRQQQYQKQFQTYQQQHQQQYNANKDKFSPQQYQNAQQQQYAQQQQQQNQVKTYQYGNVHGNSQYSTKKPEKVMSIVRKPYVRATKPPPFNQTYWFETLYANGTMNISFAAVDKDPINQNLLPYKKVFMYSLPRSGSTFIGNLFANTNDTVFFFEAFNHFKMQEGCGNTNSSLDKVHIGDLLKEIYTCHFNNIQKLQHVSWWLSASSSEAARNSCRAANPPSKLVVMKEVKSFWPYHLDYLKEQTGAGLRFIYLLRDVRGWVSSWLYTPKKQASFYRSWSYHITDFYDKNYKTCGPNNDNLHLPEDVLNLMSKYKQFLSNKSAQPHLRMAAMWTVEMLAHYHMLETHLNGQYYLLKYEDMSAHPLEATQHMYKYIGFNNVPPETATFIKSKSEGGDENDRYGTKRDSSKMTDIWKTRLDYCQIKQIEHVAKPALSLPFFKDFVPFDLGNNSYLAKPCDLSFL